MKFILLLMKLFSVAHKLDNASHKSSNVYLFLAQSRRRKPNGSAEPSPSHASSDVCMLACNIHSACSV